MSFARIAHPFGFAGLLLAVGCTSVHAPPEEIESGVYDLTIRGRADACSPARRVGPVGDVSVVSYDGLLSVPVPERSDEPGFEVSRRVTLLEDEGYHYTASQDMSECPMARVVHEWTVAAVSAGAFEVEHVQRWIGLSGCGPMDDAPDADCEAVRDLRFELQSRCLAPCSLSWHPTDGTRCVCD